MRAINVQDYGVTVGWTVAVTRGVEVTVVLGLAVGVPTGVGVPAALVGVGAEPVKRICQAMSRSSLAATGKFGKLERARSRRRMTASRSSARDLSTAG